MVPAQKPKHPQLALSNRDMRIDDATKMILNAAAATGNVGLFAMMAPKMSVKTGTALDIKGNGPLTELLMKSHAESRKKC